MKNNFLETLFTRFYVILKLNLLFWIFSLIGMLFFGMGPAFLTITRLFVQHGWEFGDITWSASWQTFKSSFKRGNAFFYSYAMIALIFIYNLYISTQIVSIWALAITFILVFAIVITLFAFSYSLILETKYEMKIVNIFKLSLAMFFMDFLTIFKILIGVGVVLWITAHSLGFILFGSIAASIIIVYSFSRKAFEKLEKALD